MSDQRDKLSDDHELLSEGLLRIVRDLLILQSRCLGDAQDAHRHNAHEDANECVVIWSLLGEAMPGLLEAQVVLYALEGKPR